MPLRSQASWPESRSVATAVNEIGSVSLSWSPISARTPASLPARSASAEPLSAALQASLFSHASSADLTRRAYCDRTQSRPTAARLHAGVRGSGRDSAVLPGPAACAWTLSPRRPPASAPAPPRPRKHPQAPAITHSPAPPGAQPRIEPVMQPAPPPSHACCPPSRCQPATPRELLRVRLSDAMSTEAAPELRKPWRGQNPWLLLIGAHRVAQAHPQQFAWGGRLTA